MFFLNKFKVFLIFYKILILITKIKNSLFYFINYFWQKYFSLFLIIKIFIKIKNLTFSYKLSALNLKKKKITVKMFIIHFNEEKIYEIKKLYSIF